MTPELLIAIAGVIVALVFEYFPVLARKYNGLQDDIQRLIMLGVLVVVSGGVYGLACSGYGAYFGLSLVCGEAGILELVRAFIIALITNQSVHRILPKYELPFLR
jgi:hypothetical protein